MSTYFLTGTDTEIGKTYVTCLLLRALAAEGKRALAMKPIAAGCELTPAGWYNSDVQQLKAASNVEAPLTNINPYPLQEAISPHLAARIEGIKIELNVIRTACFQLRQQADWVLVEGAGGVLAPISESLSIVDFAVALQLPVILVVGMRLGCLNHALLSAEALRLRGLPLAGWIANNPQAETMPYYLENLATLQARMPAPLLAEVAFQARELHWHKRFF